MDLWSASRRSLGDVASTHFLVSRRARSSAIRGHAPTNLAPSRRRATKISLFRGRSVDDEVEMERILLQALAGLRAGRFKSAAEGGAAGAVRAGLPLSKLAGGSTAGRAHHKILGTQRQHRGGHLRAYPGSAAMSYTSCRSGEIHRPNADIRRRPSAIEKTSFLTPCSLFYLSSFFSDVFSFQSFDQFNSQPQPPCLIS